jgi:hypothetical protein
MSRYQIVVAQASAGSGSGHAVHATPAPRPEVQVTQDVPSGDDIARQIRQSFQEAARVTAQAKRQTRVVTADGRQIIVSEAAPSVPMVEVRRGPEDLIPPQVVDMTIAFFIMLAVIIIGLPLARAFGRRLERRADPASLPDPAIAGQLQRIEQAVEAMSIEIERISESQRFIAKLQNGAAAERSALHAGERR